MKYDLDWLVKRVNAGEDINLIGFWGKAKGAQDEKVFSNFYPSHFEVELQNVPEGVVLNPDGKFTFNCNEQYFMYRKAVEFSDTASIVKILQDGLHPKEYKALGRDVSGFNAERWRRNGYTAMVDGLRYKFSQNDDLKAIILSSSDSVLVEAAPRDTTWGIGYSMSNENWTNPNLWRGKNLLGFALMEVRDELKQG